MSDTYQDECCKKCKFWTDLNDDIYGICRRNAPSTVIGGLAILIDRKLHTKESDDNLAGIDAEAYWPQTQDGFWCGEFKPKKAGLKIAETDEGFTPPVYFRNEQWAVTGYGIECADRKNHGHYVIEKGGLSKIRLDGEELPDWPQHLVEKNWVDIDLFMQAFMYALYVHAGNYQPFEVKDWHVPLRVTVERERRRRGR